MVEVISIVTVIIKYLKFGTFSTDFLLIFMLRSLCKWTINNVLICVKSDQTVRIEDTIQRTGKYGIILVTLFSPRPPPSRHTSPAFSLPHCAA
jgi:hypothetical protein